MFLIDQPPSTNSTASQSSSSGWVGASACWPKSSTEATIPRPKTSAQMRLTVTRAVSGFSGEVIHFASPRRLRGRSGSSVCSAAGVPGSTALPRGPIWPRSSTKLWTGPGLSAMISVVGGARAFIRLTSFSSSFLGSATSGRVLRKASRIALLSDSVRSSTGFARALTAFGCRSRLVACRSTHFGRSATAANSAWLINIFTYSCCALTAAYRDLRPLGTGSSTFAPT